MSAPRRHVWVWHSIEHPLNLQFMYSPIISTIETATLGSSFGFNRLPACKDRQVGGLLRNASLRHGDIFVSIGNLGLRHVPWKWLYMAGVLNVIYMTDMQQCAQMIKQSVQLEYVSEMWDYSHANIHGCRALMARGAMPSLPLRFVPPGHSADTNSLLAGSALDPDPLHHPHAAMREPVFFLGDVKAGRRPECLRRLRVLLGGRRLVSQPVWSAEMLRAVLANFSLFISIHKWSCGLNRSSHQAVESFRLQPLLSAGGTIISELGNAADSAQYAGLVSFAPFQHIPQAIDAALRGMRSLGLAWRRTAALRVQQEYARRSNVSRIFAAAGLWQSLTQRASGNGTKPLTSGTKPLNLPRRPANSTPTSGRQAAGGRHRASGSSPEETERSLNETARDYPHTAQPQDSGASHMETMGDSIRGVLATSGRPSAHGFPISHI